MVHPLNVAMCSAIAPQPHPKSRTVFPSPTSISLASCRSSRFFSISVALDADAYAATKELAGGCPLVLFAFGVHPWMAPEHVDRLDRLTALVAETPMIGEVGLDHHFVKDRAAYPAQMRVFEFFLAAAREQEKVVNLHTKCAEHEIAQDRATRPGSTGSANGRPVQVCAIAAFATCSRSR